MFGEADALAVVAGDPEVVLVALVTDPLVGDAGEPFRHPGSVPSSTTVSRQPGSLCAITLRTAACIRGTLP
ncbi:hypothetical protein GCM10027614_12040 [Micromonospora vulcania]